LATKGRTDGVDAINPLERSAVESAPCLFRTQRSVVIQNTGGHDHQIQRVSICSYRFGCTGDRRLVLQIEPLVPYLRMLKHWPRPTARDYLGDSGTCAQDIGQGLADATRCAHHNDAHL
jgi:hypothetical protein